MNLSQPFVRRPIGTVLLTVGVALAGIGGFFVLPVSPLPQVDYPTISVSAQLPGREPRHDGDERGDAARAPPRHDRRRQRDDVVEPGRQRARSACSSSCRATSTARRARCRRRSTPRASTCRRRLRSNPTYRKANPSRCAGASSCALTSQTLTPGQIYDTVSNIVSQRLAQVDGVGDVEIGGSDAAGGAGRAAARSRSTSYGISGEDVRAAIQAIERQPAQRARSRARAGACRSTPRRRRGAPPTTRRWSSPGATAPAVRLRRRRRGRATASRTRARSASSTASRR